MHTISPRITFPRMSTKRCGSWLVACALLLGGGSGCSRAVRGVTSSEPPVTVVAHRDAFAYERMSTRYQGAHSVADFIAKFRATPHLSKTTETIERRENTWANRAFMTGTSCGYQSSPRSPAVPGC